MTEIAGLHCRIDGPSDGPVTLLLHGYPESSYMWRHVSEALAAAGHRAIAPDLAGFGDSPADPPGTWARHVASIERLYDALDRPPLALVVHDWGGLIGLRWAVEHQPELRALVISSTGFFADGRWHGLADLMRAPGKGEEYIDGVSREAFGQLLGAVSKGMDETALDEYFKASGDETRRRGQLELYRSGDFAELAQHEGKLAALGVPALVLWGEDDPFAPVAGAHRFVAELGPGTELVVVPGTGHFVYADAPAETAAAVTQYLETRR